MPRQRSTSNAQRLNAQVDLNVGRWALAVDFTTTMTSSLPYETIRAALDAQPLFEAKTWRLSPEAWPLTREQVTQLEQIGAACLEFHQALETLYLRSVAGKNLLRNKPLWRRGSRNISIAASPRPSSQHARDGRMRGMFPPVLRPDLLLTDDGFALTELDSVPGGIGLTAFLNRLYAGEVSSDREQVTRPRGQSRSPTLNPER